jgi:hypothetical protein
MAQKAHSAIYIFPMGVPNILKAIRFLIKYRSASTKLKDNKSPDDSNFLFIDFEPVLIYNFIFCLVSARNLVHDFTNKPQLHTNNLNDDYLFKLNLLRCKFKP